GIVHGEIQAARPFAWGSGLIARASVRLVCADRGVDPSLFSIPEVGMVHVGRAACARALKAYAAGDLPTYFAWFFDAIRSGAQAATSGVPGEA
ncbi:MAG: oxidoreductase, partial [Actinomycetota bacterium]|nr:oxidoreductase [Actinomycetota bacterium]